MWVTQKRCNPCLLALGLRCEDRSSIIHYLFAIWRLLSPLRDLFRMKIQRDCGQVNKADQSVSFSRNRFPRGLFQTRAKKRARSKVHPGVLGSFWKCHKSKEHKILPGSYTTIFLNFHFSSKKLMFKPEKPGFSSISLTVSKEINRTKY